MTLEKTCDFVFFRLDEENHVRDQPLYTPLTVTLMRLLWSHTERWKNSSRHLKAPLTSSLWMRRDGPWQCICRPGNDTRPEMTFHLIKTKFWSLSELRVNQKRISWFVTRIAWGATVCSLSCSHVQQGSSCGTCIAWILGQLNFQQTTSSGA